MPRSTPPPDPFPVTCPPWRPSPDLVRDLAQLLDSIAARQRASGRLRLAHRRAATGPHVSFTDDTGFSQEEKR